ncbi:MAG: alpha/beta hydrolase [bacterium]|nr:alpha/beta hydrolase [bacterium]
MEKLVLTLFRLYFGIAGRIAPGAVGRQALRLFCTPRRRPPLRPEAEELLARAEAFDVAHEDGKLRAFRWRADEASNGRTVLLVHGWESRAARLGKWVQPLLNAGFDVVAFDGYAHGDSDGERSSLPDFVTAISEVAEAAGPFEAVVGHSMGAAAGVMAVAGAEITGLPAVPARRLVLVAGPDRALDIFRYFAGLVGLPEHAFKGFVKEIEAIGGQPVEVYSTAALLAARPVPTLLVHDPADDEVPYEHARQIVGACPEVTLMTTEGLGHHRIVRDREVIERGVAFLAGEADDLQDAHITPMSVS